MEGERIYEYDLDITEVTDYGFTLEDVHPHDLGTVIDHYGIALRTGHHCAMPVMQFFGLPATARASLGVYNTFEEIDALADSLEKTIEMFA